MNRTLGRSLILPLRGSRNDETNLEKLVKAAGSKLPSSPRKPMRGAMSTRLPPLEGSAKK